MSAEDIINVRLLLHGDGANGSTNIVDSSVYGVPITRYGSTSISTTQKKNRSSSIYFDNSGDYLSFSRLKFSFDASDFTIRWWMYKLGNNANVSRILNLDGDVYCPISARITATGDLAVWGSTTGSSDAWSDGTVTAIADNVWKHIEIVRSGGSIYAFVDGVKLKTLTTTLGTTALMTPSYDWVIGGQTSSPYRNFYGYIEDFEIRIGEALHTADFTPPGALSDPDPVYPRHADVFKVHFAKHGTKTLSGVVSRLGVPGRYLVRLFQRNTGDLIAEQYSADDGAYAFADIADTPNDYMVVALDYLTDQRTADVADQGIVLT